MLEALDADVLIAGRWPADTERPADRTADHGSGTVAEVLRAWMPQPVRPDHDRVRVTADGVAERVAIAASGY